MYYHFVLVHAAIHLSLSTASPTASAISSGTPGGRGGLHHPVDVELIQIIYIISNHNQQVYNKKLSLQTDTSLCFVILIYMSQSIKQHDISLGDLMVECSLRMY